MNQSLLPRLLGSSLLDQLEDVAVLQRLGGAGGPLDAVADDGLGEVVRADGEVVAAVDEGGEAPHHLLARALLLAVAHQQAGSGMNECDSNE